jgi:UDP-GlcNAc:undecaprenyl-phosphate/decaprenyl-phosphate GlcNAc-1-phosphate transferase
MASYGWLFLLGAVPCYLLTHVALHLGRHFRILDWPDKERKLHARATPRTGGPAIFVTVVSVVAGCHLGGWGWCTDEASGRFTLMLLISAGFLCALGLWDDKWGMHARRKLLLQTAAIIPFAVWGRSETTAALFGYQMDFAWLAIPVTLFWLVACTNFVNLVDGLDGLAGTVGLIVSATIAVLAWLHDLATPLCLSLVLAGALVGFLVHNWPPARIFLGDSGSLPLGFLVGALSLEAAAKKATGLTLAVPLVLLSIPMFDTSMAILRRKLNGLRIGSGDRAHIHHCLRDRGLTPTQTLLAIGAMCLITAAGVLAATVLNNDWIALAVCALLLTVLVSGRLFGFNEMSLLIRHVGTAGSFLREIPRELNARFLLLRMQKAAAEGRLDLWRSALDRARRLNAWELHFAFEQVSPKSEIARLVWVGEMPAQDLKETWQVQISVPREPGLTSTMRATGPLSGDVTAQSLQELVDLFAVLCRNWPVPGEMQLAAATDLKDGSRPEGPVILTPQFLRSEERPVSAKDKLEHDAA